MHNTESVLENDTQTYHLISARPCDSRERERERERHMDTEREREGYTWTQTEPAK